MGDFVRPKLHEIIGKKDVFVSGPSVFATRYRIPGEPKRIAVDTHWEEGRVVRESPTYTEGNLAMIFTIED